MSKDIQLNTEIAVWGTAKFSPWEISDALCRLRVSHSILIKPRPGKVQVVKIINRKKPQPKWVHITNMPREALRNEAVNFISISHSELQLTNFLRFAKAEIIDSVRDALLSDLKILPIVRELTPLEYVNMVAKPSLLNHIQTEVYKINPYSLRKETQEMVIKFFNSQVSLRTMERFLQKSLKQDSIIPMIVAGIPLRDAIVRLKTEPVETVAKTSGYNSFELLYLSKVRKKDK